MSVFECESAYNKYFKPSKKIIDNSMFYFCVSLVIALSQIFNVSIEYIIEEEKKLIN